MTEESFDAKVKSTDSNWRSISFKWLHDTATSITVEPTVYTMAASAGALIPIIPGLILYKLCTVNMGLDPDLCADGSENTTLKEQLQQPAADVSMYSSLVQSIPAILFTAIVGPLCDKRGSKLFMLIPLLGFLCSAIGLLTTTFLSVRAEFLILAYLPIGLTGGFTTFLMALYRFVSRHSVEKHRTTRMARVDCCMSLGMLTGILVSGYIYQQGGFIVSISFAVGLLVTAMISTALLVPNEVLVVEKRKDKCSSFEKSIELIKNVKVIWATMFCNKGAGVTACVALLMLCFSLVVSVYIGELSIVFYFLQLRYNVDTTQYSYLQACDTIARSIGLLLLVPLLHKLFHIPDEILGVLACLSYLVRTLIFALCTEGWMIYLGSFATVLAAAVTVAVRSTFSKIFSREELGQVFAVVGTAESLFPLLASVAYSQLYKATVTTLPSAAMFMTMSFMCTAILALSLSYWIRLRITVTLAVRDELGAEDTQNPCTPNTPLLSNKPFDYSSVN